MLPSRGASDLHIHTHTFTHTHEQAIIPPETQLSQVYFEITDDKNRQIPQVNTGINGAQSQAQVGLLSFKLTFKFETIVDDTMHSDLHLKGGNIANQFEHLSMNGLPRGG